ncbi:MAG: cell division protein ZipA C-terminal FtsZ-binding domain-containing protein, partial [Methylohalobius sp.]
MDKTTLRIILAILGVLLLLGIYLWDRLKRRRQALDKLLEAESPEGEFEADEIDTISINPLEETAPVDVDVLKAEESILEPRQPELEVSKLDRKAGKTEPAEAKRKLPEVIQVSIVAPPQQPFSGNKLLEAFEELGLEYGDMDIFHAYQGDEIRFSVASLVKPGTFPIDAMDDFHTRGLTLFFQPPLVSQPVEAFEHMI